METTTKRAVIFARVSSTIGDRQSTERQIVDLTSYAERNGYNVVKSFSEKISGAKKNNERPILRECLDYCFDNNIHTLLLSELSRLGRSTWEVLENIKECNDKHLNVYFQKEGLNIFNADGAPNIYLPVMISCLGMSAEMERENIKYRLNSGRTQYIANGGKLGRKEGYRKTKEAKAEQYAGVIKRLKRAEKIRDIAELEGCNPSTVQRLKKEFNL